MHDAADHADLGVRSITREMTSQVVGAETVGGFFEHRRVSAKTSRMTDAMNGMIITAKIRLAVKMPMPIGVPRKQRTDHGDVRQMVDEQGSTSRAKAGARK